MTTKKTTASASAVSRALAKAGHSRSEEYATAIRGWRNRTTGFTVEQYPAGYARVDHLFSLDAGRSGDRQAKRLEALQRYAETLTEAGWKVTLQDSGLVGASLRVEVPES